ncbi:MULTISPECIES: RNA polymerase factor sigma-32 [unclassified Azospirillum]|jgi:RNA polymerase sigma-32 factor|uniref:RNA polymerase factor sigma-32 n=1 Tax=unclassified Azospirillum TaxID=2630922 RepID=UPI000B7656F3|nr:MULTISPECIES: RNA polymerase factor sigma-32 [unclassified Azospirillum]SNS28911.1 RNA polymerase sigma-32 factor [Azospirillum sp. RU38E]SNS47385.1 RNA polymerase sigma-32 factor [Azospirillum sp. RU37A]
MASYTESVDLLRSFTSQANRFPMLPPDEEQQLAHAWTERQDRRAFDQLVKSHMRLAVKIAAKYARSGLPIADLISEANIGLVKAVQRFDPSRGFRLSTYALWWIRAEVQSFVLHNWSLIKGGNTAALKRLFFNLRQTQRKLGIEDRVMNDDDVLRVATTLGTSVEEVREMEHRFSTPVTSLNVPVGEDGDHEAIDLLADDGESVEENLAERSELRERRAMMRDALTILGERERHIFASRNLAENPVTLETLAQHYGVSKERIRQIESGAYKKVARRVRSSAELPAGPVPPMASKRARGEFRAMQ